MTTIAAAATALSLFGAAVPGMKNSYDVNATPDLINPSMLPACVIMITPGQSFLLTTRALMANQPQISFSLVHLCLVGAGDLKQYKRGMPAVVAMLDAYQQTLLLYPMITVAGAMQPGVRQATDVPPDITAKPGLYGYGDVDYYGIEFTVKFTFNR